METRAFRRAVERSAEGARTRPLLLFFTERTSGPCRRMQSLIAWLKVTRKSSLQVEEVDVSSNPSLVERLRVVSTPTLVSARTWPAR